CANAEENGRLGGSRRRARAPTVAAKCTAVDVSSRWRFCFLPICLRFKRKYFCTLCFRRLVMYDE
ncbi:hypothetical protein PHJA_001060000, partial [Phtheirospermum japonicum]